MTSIQEGKTPKYELQKLKIGAFAVAVCVALGVAGYSFISQSGQHASGGKVDASSPIIDPSFSDQATPAHGPDTSLILRLMPDSQVRGTEKLDFGMGTYVWEVDMLVDKANPQSSGFVYLSADGTKLLNGPMMDKRSRIMPLKNEAAATDLPETPIPPNLNQVPAQGAQEFNQEQAFNPQPAIEAQAQKAAYQRNQFYAGISQLNYISTTTGSNIAYVLFDPLCSACAKLYKQSTAIAAAYDVEFRWIPIFISEQSYPISALLQKTFMADKAKGLEALDQILTKQWKAEDHLMEIAALTEADYEQVKPAGSVFVEIARAVPGIGTPFVMFKNAANNVEAFGGVPLSTDWASLQVKK